MTDGFEQLDLFQIEQREVAPCPDSVLWRSPAVSQLSGLPKLYLGTSSWTFQGWGGLVYQEQYAPSELAHQGLRAYAQTPIFRTVSLDRTYYRPISVAEYRRFCQQIPKDFRFVVKAPRDLLKTFAGRIDLGAFTREFLSPTVQGLGPNLGVVLLQFPPAAAREGGSDFLAVLRRFLVGLPREVGFSLEMRDASLLGPGLREALRDTSISLCASIHPTLPDPDQQLIQVPPAPQSPLVFRWNLRPSLDYTQARNDFAPFNELRSEDPRRRHLLARLAKRALDAGREVYITVNNKAEGCAPLSLLRLLEELSSPNS